jgi:hypothetical protein
MCRWREIQRRSPPLGKVDAQWSQPEKSTLKDPQTDVRIRKAGIGLVNRIPEQFW